MYLKVPRQSPTSNIRTRDNVLCDVVFYMVPERVGLRVEGAEEGGVLGHLLPARLLELYGVASDPSTSLQV